MSTRLKSWRMVEAGRPLELEEAALPVPGPGEVLLKVRACGLCHTDVGFLYGGVRPNASLPLTLGHEIVGDVVARAGDVDCPEGSTYIVPAVLPCGQCDLCTAGRGNVCRSQKMPGNDFDGGFASHFLAPVRFLTRVPTEMENIEELSVVADAVGTAYQAVQRAGVREGSMVIVVGAGGVGTFAAQSAKACGAFVAALDVDPARLGALDQFVDLALDVREMDAKSIRKQVTAFEKEHGIPPHGRRILECSGSAKGQESAWSLLNHDATLAVVGFTLDRVELRLSNLMAFDATAFGNWGCLPDHFPAILMWIAAGRLLISPYVETFPMSRLNDLLRMEGHARRPVLIPDFDA